jgi:site-specific DNA-methyltransferase (adenine-specific)
MLNKLKSKYPHKSFLNDRIVIINANCYDVLKDIERDSVDLIFIDPPYGKLNHKIETEVDINLFFKSAFDLLKDNRFIGFFGLQPTLTDWIIDVRKYFEYKDEFIWYKRNPSSPFGDVLKVYENFLFYRKGKIKFNDIRRKYTDVKESLNEFNEFATLLDKISNIEKILKDKLIQIEIIESLKGNKKFICTEKRNSYVTIPKNMKSEKRIIRYARCSLLGLKPQNLLSFHSHNKKRNINNKEYNIKHPTVKPIDLCRYLIALSSQKNDLVFDGFLGSGTTALACIEENRRCIGVEIYKDYFDISCKRIENYLKQGSLFEKVK